MNNSALTGESGSLSKNGKVSKCENLMYAENLVFFGTLCVEGSVKGLVVRTGSETALGSRFFVIKRENCQYGD